MARSNRITPRRYLRADARRAQLLEIASELVAERGPQRTRLIDIASRAGVAKALLYQHFASKQALLAALVEHHGRALLAHFVDAQPGPDAATDLRASIRAVLGYARDNPAGWRILFVDRFDDPEIAHAQATVLTAGVQLIAQRIADELHESPDSQRVQMLAHLARNAMDGLIAWWHEHPNTSLDELADTAFAFIWHGTHAAAQHGSPRRSAPPMVRSP